MQIEHRDGRAASVFGGRELHFVAKMPVEIGQVAVADFEADVRH